MEFQKKRGDNPYSTSTATVSLFLDLMLEKIETEEQFYKFISAINSDRPDIAGFIESKWLPDAGVRQ